MDEIDGLKLEEMAWAKAEQMLPDIVRIANGDFKVTDMHLIKGIASLVVGLICRRKSQRMGGI